MTVKTAKFSVETNGFTDLIDITRRVESEVGKSRIQSGIACVFVPGSTAGVTTIEFESGAIADFKKAAERLAPQNIPYEHDTRWRDGNGFSHVRAALLGASLSVPFAESRLLIGVWQQIILVDFDNRPRTREVIVQITGE
ncbi:MAG: secondary thiamine-phosphate synthase enzyme YjbQ [Deltaproteobacteria bacterium]